MFVVRVYRSKKWYIYNVILKNLNVSIVRNNIISYTLTLAVDFRFSFLTFLVLYHVTLFYEKIFFSYVSWKLSNFLICIYLYLKIFKISLLIFNLLIFLISQLRQRNLFVFILCPFSFRSRDFGDVVINDFQNRDDDFFLFRSTY